MFEEGELVFFQKGKIGMLHLPSRLLKKYKDLDMCDLSIGYSIDSATVIHNTKR
jgi:hypothetical protein